MALRSGLTNYSSIRKPGYGSGSFGSSSLSLVKKTASAEDAIIDNQYDAGLISADSYQTELTKRLARSYLTPLQRVNLEEKITKVAITVQDAEIDRKYQAGEYTTPQILQYEKDKLAQIPQTETVAYQKQAQKVSQLTDKSEREARTAYRVAEMKRISEMPEDSSERLYEKASLYATLENQARTDGDQQQADTFATNKNNYTQSAKRADINDLITGTRLDISKDSSQPDASSGYNYYQSLLGGSPGSSAEAGGGSSEGKTSSSNLSGSTPSVSSFTSPALKNAYESLDRQQKTMNRLYQERATYENAVGQATGDQKTQLTIQLNNIDKQIETTIGGIEDTVVRIQEQQGKAAASAFNQEVRIKNQQYTKVENELESGLATGKITKEEYIKLATSMAEEKTNFFATVSDGFNSFGNDINAESYLQKADDMERIYNNLSGISNRVEDYEVISVDPGGKLTNIYGKDLKPGEFALTNVRQLKDRRVFDSNYVKIGNAFYRVHYPGEVSDSSGLPISTIDSADLAQVKGTAYIYRYDKNGNIIKTDGLPGERIDYITYKDASGKPYIKAASINDIKTLEKQGKIINDAKQGYILKPAKTENAFSKGFDFAAQKVKESIANILPDKPEEIPSLGKTIAIKALQLNPVIAPVLSTFNFGKQAIDTLSKNNIVKQIVNSKPAQQIGDFLENAKNTVGKTINDTVGAVGRFFAPPAEASTVSAVKPTAKTDTKLLAYAEGTPEQYKAIIAQASKETGISTSIISSLLKAESGFNPNAQSPVGALGIAQFMPATAKGLGINPLDVNQAIRGAAKYLKQNLDRFGGDINLALAAYNAGAGNVEKYGGVPPFEETQNYVAKINDYAGTSRPTATPSPAAAKIAKQAISTSKGKQTTALTPIMPKITIDESRGLSSDVAQRISQGNQPGLTTSNPSAQLRSPQPSKPSQPSFQLPKINVPKINVPQIKLPQISLPKINLPKINPPKQVQQAVNTVRNVVNNVSNSIKKFFRW